jgi:hypothetical protein
LPRDLHSPPPGATTTAAGPGGAFKVIGRTGGWRSEGPIPRPPHSPESRRSDRNIPFQGKMGEGWSREKKTRFRTLVGCLVFLLKQETLTAAEARPGNLDLCWMKLVETWGFPSARHPRCAIVCEFAIGGWTLPLAAPSHQTA